MPFFPGVPWPLVETDIAEALRRLAGSHQAQAEADLVSIGIPALNELIHGKVTTPPGMHPRDFFESVVSMIGQMAKRHAAEFVNYVLGDSKAAKMFAVVNAFCYLPEQDARTRSFLRDALLSTDAYLRQAAARAMGGTGEADFTDALVVAVRDRSTLVSAAAVEALRLCGDQRAEATLETRARHGKLETPRADAFEALCQIRRRQGLPLPPMAFSENEPLECIDITHLEPEARAQIRFEVKAHLGDIVERGDIVAVEHAPQREFHVRAPCGGLLTTLEVREGERLCVGVRRMLPA